MRRMLVFQHVAHEILGTLDPLLRGAGFRIRYVNFGRQPDAPSRPRRLSRARRARRPDELSTRPPGIRISRRGHTRSSTAIASGMPVLGICLGGQLIARALGARVSRNPRRRSAGTISRRPPKDATIRCSPLRRPREDLPVARRHVRHPRRRRPPRIVAGLREPGLPLRRQRLRPAVPPRGRRAADRALAAHAGHGHARWSVSAPGFRPRAASWRTRGGTSGGHLRSAAPSSATFSTASYAAAPGGTVLAPPRRSRLNSHA